MGTPHQGGNGVALGRLMVNVASMFVAADDRLLRHLERDSEWLQQQLGQYGPISGDFVTKFAFEEYATPTVLGRSIVVSCCKMVYAKCLLANIHYLGCSSSICGSTRSYRRRANCHSCRSHQHGQIRIEVGPWV
jgi:hypothetical protein